MGSDADIIAFNPEKVTPKIVEVALADYETAEQRFDEAPVWLGPLIEGATFLQEWYDALAPPPTVNTPSSPMNLGKYFFKVSWFKSPTMSPPTHCRFTYWEASTALLGGRLFAEFLEPRTERGHNLWTKLTGARFGEPDWTTREWVPLRIGDTEYRIGTESIGRAGFLQGQELEALAEEIESIQSELPTFYENLDERYQQCDAVRGHAIELVMRLCQTLTLHHSEQVLAYRYW